MNSRKLENSLQAELEVLLYCARHYSDPEAGVGLEPLLASGVDWSVVLELANAQGMLPILYRTIAESRGSVPEAIWDKLHSAGRRQVVWALRHTQELFRLLDELEAAQIPAVAYKGPVLAASAYGDIALRGFRDLDIIVPKQNMLRAMDVLLTRGYQARTSQLEEADLREGGFRRAKSAWGLVNLGNGIAVDLQWRATAFSRLNSPVDRDDFWERLELAHVAGRTVRAIPAEALLQILCIHGCRHVWERLIWICDIAAIIRSRPALDWTQLLAEAKSQGNQRIVLIGVFLAHRLLGTQLPQDVIEKAQSDPVVCKLTDEVNQRFREQPGLPASALQSRSFQLRMLERFGDRMRFSQYVVGTVAVPKAHDQAAVALPRGLGFLYHVIRPVRLIYRYGLTSLRLPVKMFFRK